MDYKRVKNNVIISVMNKKINSTLSVECRSEKTRYGFRHLAILYKDKGEIAKAKCCYYNRTWESYEFESVLGKLLKKADQSALLSKWDLRCFDKFIKDGGKQTNDSLHTIATIAQMGEIFCNSQKQKNDWKARMLKAGLESKGFIMPEDWNELSEDEKENRLNKIINTLQEAK